MYADPTHIRDNVIKTRFSDPEDELIKALARFNGRQPAVYVREAALAHIALVTKLMGEADAA